MSKSLCWQIIPCAVQCVTWQCRAYSEWQSWRSWHFQEGRFLLPTLILSGSFRGLSWPQGCSLQLRELRRTKWDNIRNVSIQQLLRKSWHRDLSRVWNDVTTLYNIPYAARRKLERGGKRWWGTGRKKFNLNRPQYLFDIYLHVSCGSWHPGTRALSDTARVFF